MYKKLLMLLLPLIGGLVASSQSISFIYYGSGDKITSITLISAYHYHKPQDSASRCIVTDKKNLDSLAAYICSSPYVCSDGVDSTYGWLNHGYYYYAIILPDGEYMFICTRDWSTFLSDMKDKWRKDHLDHNILYPFVGNF